MAALHVTEHDSNKEKAPSASRIEAIKKETKTNCATKAPSEKAFNTTRATFALAGHELLRLSSGTYIARRWGLCKELEDWSAVDRFSKLIGVQL